ncbi:hypothetical protein K502DRAFT_241044 [Neoconidiobolus thromboides FSU 785]|nr:hypothetical protein K502DRAFT_241044 [Neoconidiobolus thromboides FSU 785]
MKLSALKKNEDQVNTRSNQDGLLKTKLYNHVEKMNSKNEVIDLTDDTQNAQQNEFGKLNTSSIIKLEDSKINIVVKFEVVTPNSYKPSPYKINSLIESNPNKKGKKANYPSNYTSNFQIQSNVSMVEKFVSPSNAQINQITMNTITQSNQTIMNTNVQDNQIMTNINVKNNQAMMNTDVAYETILPHNIKYSQLVNKIEILDDLDPEVLNKSRKLFEANPLDNELIEGTDTFLGFKKVLDVLEVADFLRLFVTKIISGWPLTISSPDFLILILHIPLDYYSIYYHFLVIELTQILITFRDPRNSSKTIDFSEAINEIKKGKSSKVTVDIFDKEITQWTPAEKLIVLKAIVNNIYDEPAFGTFIECQIAYTPSFEQKIRDISTNVDSLKISLNSEISLRNKHIETLRIFTIQHYNTPLPLLKAQIVALESEINRVDKNIEMLRFHIEKNTKDLEAVINETYTSSEVAELHGQHNGVLNKVGSLLLGKDRFGKLYWYWANMGGIIIESMEAYMVKKVIEINNGEASIDKEEVNVVSKGINVNKEETNIVIEEININNKETNIIAKKINVITEGSKENNEEMINDSKEANNITEETKINNEQTKINNEQTNIDNKETDGNKEGELNKTVWKCVNDEESLNQLLSSLNQDGIREKELYTNIKFNKQDIINSFDTFNRWKEIQLGIKSAIDSKETMLTYIIYAFSSYASFIREDTEQSNELYSKSILPFIKAPISFNELLKNASINNCNELIEIKDFEAYNKIYMNKIIYKLKNIKALLYDFSIILMKSNETIELGNKIIQEIDLLKSLSESIISCYNIFEYSIPNLKESKKMIGKLTKYQKVIKQNHKILLSWTKESYPYKQIIQAYNEEINKTEVKTIFKTLQQFYIWLKSIEDYLMTLIIDKNDYPDDPSFCFNGLQRKEKCSIHLELSKDNDTIDCHYHYLKFPKECNAIVYIPKRKIKYVDKSIFDDQAESYSEESKNKKKSNNNNKNNNLKKKRNIKNYFKSTTLNDTQLIESRGNLRRLNRVKYDFSTEVEPITTTTISSKRNLRIRKAS